MNSLRHILLWFWLLVCWRANAAAPSDDWPMFRGGPALAGVAGGSLPERLELLWTFKTGGPVKSSAAIVQGQVFIGSEDGNFYALGLADGKKVWAFKTGGGVESSPLVMEGRVFVGSSDSRSTELGKAGNREWSGRLVCNAGRAACGGEFKGGRTGGQARRPPHCGAGGQL